MTAGGITSRLQQVTDLAANAAGLRFIEGLRLGAGRQRTIPGIGEEGFQPGNTAGAATGQIDLVRLQGREDQHFQAGPRNSDIQATPAALTVERTKIQADLAVLVRTIADREQDHIPFITLDILQILDKQRLTALQGYFFQLRTPGKQLVQAVVDQQLLDSTESDNAQALAAGSRVFQPPHHFSDDRLCFSRILTAFTPLVLAFDRHEADFRNLVIGRGECQEFIVIVLHIAESNQALMPAAIMPEQVRVGNRHRQAVVQNAFQILDLDVLFILSMRGKEIRWWHLARVTNDHSMLAAGQDADRFTGRHLRSLVKNDQVEWLVIRIKILRSRNRAHQQAGAEPGQQAGDLVKQGPDADAAATAADSPLQDTQLGALGGFKAKVRHPGCQPGEDLLPGQAGKLLIQGAEAADPLSMMQTGEGIQRGFSLQNLQDQGKVQGLFCGRQQVIMSQSLFVGSDRKVKASRLRLLAGSLPGDPFTQAVQIGRPGRHPLLAAGQIITAVKNLGGNPQQGIQRIE